MSNEEKILVLQQNQIHELQNRIVFLETKLLMQKENKEEREERIFIGLYLFSLLVMIIILGVVLYQGFH
jgi:hypothetical protein